MSSKLRGRVALVTGGSRGIGAAIAEKLAADGADVAISYSGSADKAAEVVKKIQAKGGKGAAFQADQSKPDQVEGLVQKVVAQFGRLDILVNNAGVFVMGAVGDPAADEAALARQRAVNAEVLITISGGIGEQARLWPGGNGDENAC